ncbi:hypothetical protein [Nocardioides sp. YIM 152588]|uniref:hypothetical protein n=1 Tax=Nocardioides sp. YIM 152588 TaxID=3158259 RepID=UPI0032E41F00
MPAQNALATYRLASQTAASGSEPRTSKNGTHGKVDSRNRASSAACGITRKKPHIP